MSMTLLAIATGTEYSSTDRSRHTILRTKNQPTMSTLQSSYIDSYFSSQKTCSNAQLLAHVYSKHIIHKDAQTNGALEANSPTSNGVPIDPLYWIRNTRFPDFHPNEPYTVPPVPESLFEEITLPGPNYVVGPPLFYHKVIASYNGIADEHTKHLQFVKDEAKRYYPGATSLVFFTGKYLLAFIGLPV